MYILKILFRFSQKRIKMVRIIAVYAGLLVFLTNMNGQESDQSLTDALAQVDSAAFQLAWGTDFGEKERIFSSILAFFEENVKTDAGFKKVFDFENISFAISPDSTLRIYSGVWQKRLNEFDYYSFVQYNGEEKGWLVLRNSVGKDFDDPDRIDLNHGEWFGGLCYQIHPYTIGRTRQYLIFSFNMYTGKERRKIVEFVRWENNQLIPQEILFRDTNQRRGESLFVLQYSWENTPVLRYDEKEKFIIFDHLIPAPSVYDRDNISLVSDGTYEAFILKKDRWEWEEIIEINKQKTPPNFPTSKRDQGTDILGRKNR